MSIWRDVFMGLGVGVFYSVIDSWNRKVLFFIILLCFLSLIFGDSLSSDTVNWIDFLISVVFGLIGIKLGKDLYKDTFFKN